MQCEYCNKHLSNKSSLRRHNNSDMHKWNLQDPKHCIYELFGKDIGGLILSFAWGTKNGNTDSSNSILDLISLGYLWKALNLIRANNFSMIRYVNIPSHGDIFYRRELEFIYGYGHMFIGRIRSGEFELTISYGMNKIWKKLSPNVKKNIHIPFRILADSSFVFVIRNIHTNYNTLILSDY